MRSAKFKVAVAIESQTLLSLVGNNRQFAHASVECFYILNAPPSIKTRDVKYLEVEAFCAASRHWISLFIKKTISLFSLLHLSYPEKRMKNLTLIAALLASTSALAGETTVQENDIGAYVPHCSSQVASVSVGKLQCKATGCQKREAAGGSMGGMGAFLAMAAAREGIIQADFSGIGDGMAYALTTALKATGCFDIQERDAMEELQKEAALSGLKIEIKPADFLLTGAITSVGIETSKSSFGGGLIPVIGGFSKTTKKASLAMDIRVVDIKKANVKASKSFNSNDASSSWGISGGGYGAGGALFGGHSVSKSPEMDKLAADTVIFATSYLVDTLAANAVVSRPVVKKELAKEVAPESAQSEAGVSENVFGIM